MVFYLNNWKNAFHLSFKLHSVQTNHVLSFLENTVIILSQSRHSRSGMKLEVLHTKKEYESNLLLHIWY